MRKRYNNIVYIYVICVIVLLTITFNNKKSLYNKLTIIDDNCTVKEKFEKYVPVKIEFYNKKWGGIEINQKKTIDYIFSIVNNLPKVKTKGQEIYINKLNSIIDGNIYYLNGMKEEFYISNNLIINGIMYGNKYNEPDIEYLKNYLDELLYIPEKLAMLINDDNKVELICSNVQKMIKLDNNDKNKIKNSIMNCEKIMNVNQLRNKIQNKGDVIYHIKIYINNDNEAEKEKMYLINIDIYNNEYFIVSDFQNENGNLIHMAGNLKNVCDYIYKNYALNKDSYE